MVKSRFALFTGPTLVLAVSLLAGVPMRAGAQAVDFIDGQVTNVDHGAGKITIKHGPVKKFGMDEGHTMVFKAQDPAMLKAVKAGDKIKFDADDVNANSS